jgi:hypothetical protein
MSTPSGIILYRRILRLHRSLPPHLRGLGDSYVGSEFRLHRKTEVGDLLTKFTAEWEGYAKGIENELDRRKLSSSLGGDDREKKWGKNMNDGMEFTDEQMEQLAKLREESVMAAEGKSGGASGGGEVKIDRG